MASVPNSRTFGEDNPFHLTDFDPDAARETFARFPDHVMLTQHMVEGGLITVPGAEEFDTRLVNVHDAEEEYANHYLLLSNCPLGALRADDWRMFLSAAPVHNRYMRGLEIANQELRRINARLSRTLLGKTAAAAAKRTSAVNQHVERLEQQVEELQNRVRDERERGDAEHGGRKAAEDRLEHVEGILRAGPLEAASAARRWGR